MKLPHLYEPYPYQVPLWNAMRSVRRALLVWHRRAGKDKTVWNYLITQALTGRVGAYYYFFPTYAQAKKVIWDGLDGTKPQAIKFLSHIPEAYIARNADGRLKLNETEMQVELTNGSIIQLVGTDKINSIRGTNPVGCVFSEYSYQDPEAWDTIEPILLENGGWAIFDFTPNRETPKNHAFKLYEAAKEDPSYWFTSLLTIRETRRLDGSVVIDEAELDRLRKRGVEEDLIQREYFCSFEGSVSGSYYGKLIDQLWKDGRITAVPHDPHVRVESWWDIGMDDATAIWFIQRARGGQLRAIDYLEKNDEGLPYYAGELAKRGYNYSRHVFPHDMAVRDFGSGRARLQTATSLGLRPSIVVPSMPITDGINAVRTVLPMMWIDAVNCARGVKALTNYRKAYDDVNKTYRNTPVHDWASHGSDAFRTGASSGQGAADEQPLPPAVSNFDPLTYDVERDFDVFAR